MKVNNIALKISFALAGGMVFWALFGMVFIVYGFFPPGVKDTNQYIFLVGWPILYFTISSFLMIKIFKDGGMKNIAINALLIITGGALALGLVVGAVEFLGMLLGR